MKLSRILSNRDGVSRKRANALIAAGRVTVNGTPCRVPARDVDRFSTVRVDEAIIQPGDTAHYLMLHKPAGYLSATVDDVHTTVLDLIAPSLRQELHIAGRLDRASTGLLILTNDGTWSRQLTEPKIKLPKVYRVETADPISQETAQCFAEGIWFEFEQLRTSPATLELLGPQAARVTIYEGRYHQVKRMFHAVGNRITSLHREQMGAIELDAALAPGDSRPLTAPEIDSVRPATVDRLLVQS
ncbi:pseudouridine synthase [Marinobacter sp. F4218]|uniref:pseudouridine synthase n=1 Tax=Marinobacter sp. F4218 TaxID=2862868 RepID=UPI001C6296DA|nr:pseudouridine synthase [Marinobacter sp. F4218]MBW7470725.1 pseudouridine synthase [Marinobacter sp. F4218]